MQQTVTMNVDGRTWKVPVSKRVREVEANRYYALMFSALAFGGVGKGIWSDYADDSPVCILGHDVAIRNGHSQPEKRRGLTSAWANDSVVSEILNMNKLPAWHFGERVRIPWDVYVVAMGLVPKE